MGASKSCPTGDCQDFAASPTDISPMVVTQAKQWFNQTRRLFRIILFAYAILCLLYIRVIPLRTPSSIMLVGGSLRLLSILVSLYFIYRRGVPYAGRMIAMIWGLACYAGLPESYWSDSVYSIPNLLYVLPALAAFAIGWLMDLSIRVGKRTGSLLLTGAGILYASCALLRTGEHTSWAVEIISLSGSAALVVAALWREQVAASCVTDSPLLNAAWRRVNRRFAGQLLAVVLGAYPVLLLVNALGVPQQLGMFRSHEVIRTPRFQGETAWFWSRHGQLLTEELLTANEIFGLYGFQFKDFEQNDLCELLPRSGTWRIPSDSIGIFKDNLHLGNNLLLPSMLKSTSFFPERNMPFLVHVEQYPDMENQTRNFISCGLSNEWIPLTSQEVSAYQSDIQFLVWPLLALWLLGFIILWQQGGASWSVLFIGSVLIGAVGGFGDLSNLFLPSVRFGTWTSALQSLAGGASFRILILIQQIGLATQWLFRNGILSAAVFATLVVRRRQGQAAMPLQKRVLQFVVGLGAVFGSLFLTRYLLAIAAHGLMNFDLLTSTQEGTLAHWISYGLSIVGISLLFLWAHRSQKTWWGGWESSRTAVILVLMAVSVSAMTVLITQGIVELPSDPISSLISIALMFIELAIGMYLIIRWKELHVLDSRGLSTLVLVAIFPVLIEAFESVGGALLAASPFFVSGGAGVLSIVVAVAVLGPLQKRVESLVRYVIVPGLRTIEAAVSDTVEMLADSDSIEESRRIITALLTGDRLGITEYAYYYRQGRGRLSLLIETLPGDLPATLEISAELWPVLSLRRDFIDIDSTKFSMSMFFERHELERLLTATRSRFLLPVNHGKCLMGVLFLPEEAPSYVVERQPMAELIGRVVTRVSHRG